MFKNTDMSAEEFLQSLEINNLTSNELKIIDIILSSSSYDIRKGEKFIGTELKALSATIGVYCQN